MTDDRKTDPAPQIESTQEVVALVVDDDPMSVDILMYQLPETVKKYMTLNRASSLSEAFHRIESGERIDVVLLDLGLPGTSGRQTLLEFRKYAPNMPVVVLTGNDDDELKKQLVDDGAFSYLVKGQLSPREIMNIVVRVAVGNQTNYRLAPNEPEILRKSTAAQARLRRAMSLPPEAPMSRKELDEATHEVVMTQAAENSLAHSKLDRVLSEVSKMNYHIGGLTVKVNVMEGDIKELKRSDKEFESELGTARIQRIEDKAESKVRAAEAKAQRLKENWSSNTDMAKARWAAAGTLGVAIIGLLGALIQKGCQ